MFTNGRQKPELRFRKFKTKSKIVRQLAEYLSTDWLLSLLRRYEMLSSAPGSYKFWIWISDWISAA